MNNINKEFPLDEIFWLKSSLFQKCLENLEAAGYNNMYGSLQKKIKQREKV